jgi:hypothetical protein
LERGPRHLEQRFIRRLTLAEEIAGLILLGALATGLTLWLRSPWSSLAVTTAVWFIWDGGVGLSGSPVVAAAGVTVGGRIGTDAWQRTGLPGFFEQREKRHIKSVLQQVGFPNVVNELLRSQNLSLSGARREVTVFFADVRGFTALTDQSQERAEQYVREHQLTGEAAEACYANQAGEILATVNLYLPKWRTWSSNMTALSTNHRGLCHGVLGRAHVLPASRAGLRARGGGCPTRHPRTQPRPPGRKPSPRGGKYPSCQPRSAAAAVASASRLGDRH